MCQAISVLSHDSHGVTKTLSSCASGLVAKTAYDLKCARLNLRLDLRAKGSLPPPLALLRYPHASIVTGDSTGVVSDLRDKRSLLSSQPMRPITRPEQTTGIDWPRSQMVR